MRLLSSVTSTVAPFLIIHSGPQKSSLLFNYSLTFALQCFIATSSWFCFFLPISSIKLREWIAADRNFQWLWEWPNLSCECWAGELLLLLGVQLVLELISSLGAALSGQELWNPGTPGWLGMEGPQRSPFPPHPWQGQLPVSNLGTARDRSATALCALWIFSSFSEDHWSLALCF